MITQKGGRWDILLADLSLILFVVTLGGLVSLPTSEAAEQDESEEQAQPDQDTPLDIAPSQALYRSIEGGPSLAQWLKNQPRDPRATLTIFLDYTPDQASQSFAAAAQLIEQANAEGVEVRTVVKPSEQADIYASLAFDALR